jgi:hypothetical protein
MTKEELESEAALILEQEGWLLTRLARETNSARLRRLAERYESWLASVSAFRVLYPGRWPEPPDNS